MIMALGSRVCRKKPLLLPYADVRFVILATHERIY